MTRKGKVKGNNHAPAPFSVPRSALGTQKILIVDDRKENLVALRQALEGIDADIVEACSGNDALAATLDHRFAVAIIDIKMPGMSGYELAEHLRGDEKTRNIPIVFMTASYGDEQHMFRGYEVGGVDYIVKPFDTNALRGKVRVFLEIDGYREELLKHRDHLKELVDERTAELKERVKEIRCLYSVSSLVAGTGESIDDALQEAVELIPQGFQFPDEACVRITFEDRVFTTDNFKETAWSLSAGLDNPRIGVTVYYLEEEPEKDEGPFLEEERHLVKDIVRQLSVMIERERARERERHLAAVLRSIRDVNQLIVREKRRDRLIETACEKLVRGRGFHGAWIALTDRMPDCVEGAQVGFNAEDFKQFTERIRQGNPPACCRGSKSGNAITVTEHVRDACEDCPLSGFCGEHASMSLALRHNGREYGFLGILVPILYADDQDEKSLLDEIGGDISFALNSMEVKAKREESEQFLNAVIEQSPESLWISDNRGTLMRMNRACRELFGVTEEEVVGKYNILKDNLVEVQGHMPLVRAVFEKGDVARFTIDYDVGEVEHIDVKGGTHRILDVVVSPIRDAQGDVTDVLVQHKNITDLRQAEEDLRRSRHLLNASEALSAVGGWEWDVAAQSMTWTDGTYRIHDFEPDAVPPGSPEHIARSLACYDPLDRERVAEAFRRCAEEGEPYDLECGFTTATGRRLRIRTMAQAVRESGRIVKIVGNLQDITAQRRAEEKLRYNEMLLREMGRIARIGGWEFDPDTGRGTWTEEVARIHDLDPEDETNVDIGLSVFRGESRERIEQAIRDAVEQGKSYDLELEMVTVKGAHKWVRTIGNPMIENGKVARVRGSFQDITDLKRAEEKVRESEDFIRAVLDNLPVGVAVNSVDPAVAFSYMNDSFPRIYRTTREALADRDAFWEAVYEDPVFRAEIRKRVLEDCASGNPGSMRWENVPIRREGQETSFISAHNIPVTGKDLAISMVWDVTERKRAEEELRRHRDNLEELVAERTVELEAFSYSVSHDLRAPLRAIDGFANILLEEHRDALEEEGKRLLGIIMKNVNSMGKLIDDLLSFSRLGRQEMKRMEIDVRALVREVIDNLMQSENNRNIEWKIDTLPSMIGDRSMIRQVYANLLSNAIKFTRKKDVTRIEAGFRQIDEEIVYFVRDNGAGFDMQYGDKLFGVFQRLHSEKEFEGTGVGLANVRRIVHRHGGRIWAEGKVGEGATFYFTIMHEEGTDEISR